MLNVHAATDEQLQLRKEELTHLMDKIIKSPFMQELDLEYEEFFNEWHDIDEEQETRVYYNQLPDEPDPQAALLGQQTR